jgi:hypothetical protein
VTAGFPAELVTEDGRIACRIENVSLAGAKLRVSHPVRLEGHVRLDHGGRSGPGGRCLWAKADSLGVRFEDRDFPSRPNQAKPVIPSLDDNDP